MFNYYEASLSIQLAHQTDSSLVIVPYQLTLSSRGQHGEMVHGGGNAILNVDDSGLQATGRIDQSWPFPLEALAIMNTTLKDLDSLLVAVPRPPFLLPREEGIRFGVPPEDDH